ncbi:MAG: elongation factor Ts [Patescibacteria group bacterium]
MPNIDVIKQLREATGISVVECQKALKDSGGDIEKAKEILKKWGKEFARSRTERETKQGIVDSYIHLGKKVGVMIELRCETDFVAKSDDFKNLSHELCLQIAAISSDEVPLFSQPWIKDQGKTIKDLIEAHIAKLGENIVLEKFIRYAL